MRRIATFAAILSLAWLAAGCVPPPPREAPGTAAGAPRIELPPMRPAPERIPSPLKLSANEMRELLASARRGAGSDPLVHSDPPANIVVVSIYARDSRGRPLSPFPALGQAGGPNRVGAAWLAGNRAALELRGKGWSADKSAFKLDVPAAPGPVREGPPRLDPGVEGLVTVSARGRQVYVPASLYLTDKPDLGKYRRAVAAAAGLPGDAPARHRTFRAAAFVGLSPGAVPLALFRGRPLLAEPDAREMRAAARAGTRWLVGAVRGNGRFYYRYYPAGRRYQEEGYNFARHCGTTWGLYLACQRGEGPEVMRAANRTMNWARAFTRVQDHPGKVQLPMYKTPGPTASGAALTILAMVEAVRVGGRRDLLPLAVRLGDLSLESFGHESGRFWSWWDPRSGKPAGELSFIYHPGEMIWALTGLYEVSGQERFLDAAVKGMVAQVQAEREHYQLTKSLPPDAWTIQAVEALERVAPPRKEWRDHAFLLADSLLSGQYGSPKGPKPKAPDYTGGMNNLDPPIPCAAGSRGEGVASACRLALKAGDAGRAARYRRGLLSAARFALEGQYRAENSFWLPDPGLAAGGVCRSLTDTRIRIDYVQHCVATWSAAADLLDLRPAGK
jgi:hypothetical protein